MNEPTPGRYRHYKGNEYTVLGLARHSETHEELVVYRQEYGDHGLWVRPKQMFLETVKVNGQEVPRFQPLGSSNENLAENVKNIFDDLPQHLPKELVQILVHAADVRIEHLRSAGLFTLHTYPVTATVGNSWTSISSTVRLPGDVAYPGRAIQFAIAVVTS